ncbi:hypothetical protein [Pseudofulvimonas gallinarii]|nr:hypothetical protein [Pseudofulvimonas gallinarii]
MDRVRRGSAGPVMQARLSAVWLVLALLCAVLASADALRALLAPPVLDIGEHRQVLVADLVARMEDGPTLRAAISPARLQMVESALPAQASAIAMSPAALVLSRPDASPKALRLAIGDHRLLRLLSASVDRGSLSCDTETVFPGAALATSLGLQPGDRIHLDGHLFHVGPAVNEPFLSAFASIMEVDAFACLQPASPLKPASAQQLLILQPRSLDVGAVQAALASLGDPTSDFVVEWNVTTLRDHRDQALDRRAGWLTGISLILWLLAIGFAVISGLNRAVATPDSDRIRRLLGEAHRHRVRRLLSTLARDIGLVAATAAVVTVLTLPLLGDWVAARTVSLGLLWRATMTAAALAVLLVAVATLTRAVSMWNGPASAQMAGARVSRTTRPVRLMVAVAALLGAATTIPTLFLLHEFVRQGALSPGYRMDGLYAAELRMVSFDSHDQAQWWQALDQVRQAVLAVEGVVDAGFIHPAPWAYDSSAEVLGGDEHLLVNVGLTEGVLRMLGANVTSGSDVADTRDANAVLVQGLDAAMQRLFLPLGTSVVGEVSGIRFSLRDERGRPAVFRSLRAGIHDRVQLVWRRHPGAGSLQALQAALERFADRFIVSAPYRVTDYVHEKTQAVRATTYLSVLTALAAIALLAMVMVYTAREYFVQTRRDNAIRACLGATPTGLAWRASLAFGGWGAIGWLVGTVLGLLLWRQLVILIADYRLVQAGWGWWLTPLAVTMMTMGYFLALRQRLCREDMARGLLDI